MGLARLLEVRHSNKTTLGSLHKKQGGCNCRCPYRVVFSFLLLLCLARFERVGK